MVATQKSRVRHVRLENVYRSTNGRTFNEHEKFRN